MAANMADTAQSWVLAPDGTYTRDLGGPGKTLFSCHQFFMENPSLSGRGTAGAKDAPRLVPVMEDPGTSGAAAE
jgi:polyphosphate kinase